MGTLLDWFPLLWAMRIALLVLLAGCSYVYLLLITPFFRPAHVLRLLRADLPRVLRIGAEFAGTRADVEFERARHDMEAGEERTRGITRQGSSILTEGIDDASR
jgi:hypothetical protein